MKEKLDKNIRPVKFDDYIGQDKVKNNLKIFIKAALIREESLDHVLLYGPPGLGKTTLAYIIANELGVNIKSCAGPTLEKPGDIASLLSSLNPGDVLFIDEIHRIPIYIEEILYQAMEDFELDIIIQNDNVSKSIKIQLPPFTLVGATTKIASLSAPLRDRFGILSKLEYYKEEELSEIILRTAEVLNTSITKKASLVIASRSRNTPRIANRLLKRIYDFSLVENQKLIDEIFVLNSLDLLSVDSKGLDLLDNLYLENLVYKFQGGPVGGATLATSMEENIKYLEEVIEPFLIKEGYIKRTTRGRIALDKSYIHVRKEKL